MQLVSLVEIKLKILKSKIPCNVPFHNASELLSHVLILMEIYR